MGCREGGRAGGMKEEATYLAETKVEAVKNRSHGSSRQQTQLCT